MSRVVFLTLINFIFFASLKGFTQEMDQVSAMKNVESGLYNFWRISNGDICHQDGEVEVKVNYNDKKVVESVAIGRNVYTPSFLYVLGDKKHTGLYFQKADRMVLMYYNDRLFIYERKSDDSFYTARAMVGGRKEGKYMKDFTALQEHNIALIEKEKELKEEITAKMQFTDPDKFYKKVYKEAEGYRKVEDRSGKIGFINAKNEVIIAPQYDKSFNAVTQGIVGVEKEGKQGYVNMQNKELIKIENDQVFEIQAGLILAKKQDKYQFYFPSGKKIGSDFDYVRLEKLIDKYYLRAKLDHGYIGSNGEIEWFLKGRDYDDIIISGNNFIVKKNEKFGLITKGYDEVLAPVYNEINLVKGNTYAVTKGDVAGYYTVGKGFVTELIYAFANEKGETKYGFVNGDVDEDGNISWDDKTKTIGVALGQPVAAWRANYTSSGALKTGELTLVEKNGKFGFVNDLAELVIPVQYDGVEGSFEHGLIGVKINYKYGVINESGEVIIPLKYDQIGRIESDQLTVYENKKKLIFNLDGTPIEVAEEVVEAGNVASQNNVPVQNIPDYGNQKGVSFYSFDAVGHNEPFAFLKEKTASISGFPMKNGNIVNLLIDYSGDEPKTSIRSYDPRVFQPYIIDEATTAAQGCETETNEMVVVVKGQYYHFKIAAQKLVKVNQYNPSREDRACFKLYHADNGNVIGLWGDDTNYFIEVYNYRTNKTATYDCGKKYSAIKLDVSLDKSFAAVSFMNEEESNTMRLVGFDLKNGINGSKLVPKFDKKHKKYHSVGIVGSVIAMNNEIIVLYQSSVSFVQSHVTLFMNKYNEQGELLKSVMLPGVQSYNWSRSDAQSLNIYGQFNYFIFNLRSYIGLVKNPRTGHVYISARMGAGGLYFSYGPDSQHKRSGKAASDVPFLVSIDEKTLEYDGYDFIALMIDGEFNDAYGNRKELGSLYLREPIISSTPEKTYLIFPENTSNKSTLLWQANFQRTGKGGIESVVANNNSNQSSNNNNNSSSSSAGDDKETKEVQKDQGPQFTGSVTLKNDTDDQVHCWISTGGSGWISKGGSKTFRCQKGAKVYFSDSNSSSSKEFAFETNVDHCGKTIKISSVR